MGKKVLGIRTGYKGGGATGAGDQWDWNKKVPIGDIHPENKRNGGMFASYYEAAADKTNQGTFYYHTIHPKVDGHNVYRNFKHPTDDEPKLLNHYETGSGKYFYVGHDRSGWMYQTKNITNASQMYANKDKILYFEKYGQRDDLYSFCWTSFCDPHTDAQYLEKTVNNGRAESSYFSSVVCEASNSIQNIGNQYYKNDNRKLTSSRLRNVVGFSVNTMSTGSPGGTSEPKYSAIYPYAITLLMQKPGDAKIYHLLCQERNASSLSISQRFDTDAYWGNGTEDSKKEGTLRAERGKVQYISYYCTQDQIDVIVRDKFEFVGVWWKMGVVGQGGGATKSAGAIAFWNFRPLCVGSDGSLVDTWNTKTYNILPTPRNQNDYSWRRGIALS